MPIQILMPALSPTMTSGNLTKWHKKEGDLIKAGQLIAEVETDKATMEIEASEDGMLAKILVPEKSTNVLVNSVIAVLLEDDEDAASLANFIQKKPSSSNLTPIANLEPTPSKEKITPLAGTCISGKIFASPLAKRIAEQNQINLKDLCGSGPNGRIIKNDVLTALENLRSITQQSIVVKSVDAYTLEPHSPMRRVIASRLSESKQTIPHFYLNIECRLDNLIALRHQVNKDRDSKISINDFVIKATALSMKDQPSINASWHEEGIRKYANIDISVAVSVDDGLITPIIYAADARSLSEISLAMKDLAARARLNKLRLEEFQGGNFTISNLGMYGVKQFSAIINPPQSSILAIGATLKTPTAGDNDKVEIANIMSVTLSCDHRVVDGVLGAKFLQCFKNYLENPIKMLV
jgi:pyruvate dehydrogenase E2 component (dihydrolipoamide acetyltransferase)